MFTRSPFFIALVLVACQANTPRTVIPAPRPLPIYTEPRTQEAKQQRERPPASTPGPLKPFPGITSTTLGNGLTLDVIERRALPVVQLSLVVATGHAVDGQHPGAARLTAEMLEAGGAGKWTSEKLRAYVDGLGSSLNIASTRDTMQWSLAVTSDKVGDALEVLASLARSPHFDPTEFRKLKGRELERIRSLAKTSGGWLAQYWLNRELYQQALGIHPYASIDTLPNELERLTLADCRAFHRAHVLPSNARILAVGDVDPSALTAQVERTFGTWAGKPADQPPIGEPMAPETLKIYVVDRPGSAQSDIVLGLPGPPRGSDEFTPILVIQQIVGGGVAGRLFLDVREKRSLAYSTYAGIQEVSFGPSVLTFSAGTQTPKTAETVSALLEHLERVAASPFSLEELETAQSYMVRGMPMRWESVESLSNQLLLLRTQRQPDRYFDELREQISSLSTPVLAGIAPRFYRRNRAVVVVAGDADKVAESLRKFGPVEVLNPEREFSIKRKLSAE